MRSAEEIDATAADKRAFSNHSEYDVWASRHCYECVHDDDATEKWCPILGVALMGKWPAEWTRRAVEFTSVEGKPMSYDAVDTCTEFEERRDDDGPDDGPETEPGPGPFVEEMPGQTDIFTFIVEDALGRYPVVTEEVTTGA